MSVAEQILARLEGVKPRGPGRWVARCPAHKDRSPSLSIRERPDGSVLVHCFAECDTGSVLAAIELGVGDLFPDRFDHNAPRGSAAGAHAHAAADVLKILAHETTVVELCADDLAAGMDLTPEQRERLRSAALRIHAARRFV